MKQGFLTIIFLLAALLTATAQTPKDSASYQLTAQDSANMKQYELGGVTVEGARKYVKNDIDKLTYDVQRDDDSKTKNVLEMLRKVPMVTVDGQDNIKIKGQSSFKIYKNGHPDPSFNGQTVSQILKGMPASSIKKIEVITDPGAKYDAEGTTYILNIVMKDGSDLHGVSATLSSGANQRGSIREGANVIAQSGKLVFSADYYYMHITPKQQEQESSSASYYKDTSESLFSNSRSKNNPTLHIADFSASYDIDSLNLLSMSLGGYFVNVGNGSWANGDIRRFDSNMQPIYSYRDNTRYTKYNYYEFNGRIDYQHKTHLDGEILTLSYMGSTTRENTEADHTYSDMVNMPVDYNAYSQKQNEQFYEHTWQVDYVRPLGKHNKIEGGAKYIYRLNKSNTSMDYSTDDDDMHSKFKHNTQIAAVYGQWLGKFGKWDMRAGLRYEYSYLKAEFPDGSEESFHKNLSDWCPSASIQYDFSDANNLRFNYGTSINRPGISYLNPARISTPTSLTYGNPNLNSAMTHSLALTYTHIGKITFNISPAVYITNDRIDDIDFVQDNVDVSTYGNVVHEHNFWLSYYLQANPWKGADLSVNGGTGYGHTENPSFGTNGLKLHGWNGDIDLNYSQKLPWKLRLGLGGGLSYGHEPKSVYGYGSNHIWNYLSLQRSFLKDDRLTVQFVANSILHPNNVIRTRTVQGDTTGWSRWERNNQQFGIFVSLRLGKIKASVKHAERSIENNDVVGGMSAKGAQ